MPKRRRKISAERLQIQNLLSSAIRGKETSLKKLEALIKNDVGYKYILMEIMRKQSAFISAKLKSKLNTREIVRDAYHPSKPSSRWAPPPKENKSTGQKLIARAHGPTLTIRRCECGAPAMPGDDYCFNCRPE